MLFIYIFKGICCSVLVCSVLATLILNALFPIDTSADEKIEPIPLKIVIDQTGIRWQKDCYATLLVPRANTNYVKWILYGPQEASICSGNLTNSPQRIRINLPSEAVGKYGLVLCVSDGKQIADYTTAQYTIDDTIFTSLINPFASAMIASLVGILAFVLTGIIDKHRQITLQKKRSEKMLLTLLNQVEKWLLIREYGITSRINKEISDNPELRLCVLHQNLSCCISNLIALTEKWDAKLLDEDIAVKQLKSLKKKVK